MPEPPPHAEDCDCEWCDPESRRNLVAQAKVGMIALVDEATGYQEERPSDELARLHERYLETPDQTAERIGRETTERVRRDHDSR